MMNDLDFTRGSGIQTAEAEMFYLGLDTVTPTEDDRCLYWLGGHCVDCFNRCGNKQRSRSRTVPNGCRLYT